MNHSTEDRKPPYYITPLEELDLRIQTSKVTPSPVISAATSFDDFVRQLMVPGTVTELYRRASGIRFSAWETESIRASLAGGILKEILARKFAEDGSHPPYIRVACTGNGTYDHLAGQFGCAVEEDEQGDYGSPTILEIWPAKHYSPMHSHGDTTGIVYCLTGQIDVMVYDSLDWNAKKLGLVTLTPGQCAWLTDRQFAVHKVYCPMTEGNFAATFHVYLNKDEQPLLMSGPEPHTRDEFDYVDENPPHEVKTFVTYSDLSWRILRREMANYAAKMGL